jgi:hypothetical protein
MSVCLGDEIEIAATNLTDVKKGEKIIPINIQDFRFLHAGI